jgi:hypothetical protein
VEDELNLLAKEQLNHEEGLLLHNRPHSRQFLTANLRELVSYQSELALRVMGNAGLADRLIQNGDLSKLECEL